MLHGRSLEDGLVSTARLVRACSSLDADVLCLQEVDRGQRRSGGADQTAEIAGALGAVAWRFEPALIGEPGGRWRAVVDGDSAAAGYGVGLVSRLPVNQWQVTRMAAAKVKAPVAVPGGRGRMMLLPDEPRVSLAAEVEGPFGPLTVVTTHLSFVPGWNLVQLRRLARDVSGRTPAAVLLGDLNLPAPLPAWVSRWKPLVSARTFPAGRPSMQIDHILGHGVEGRVRAAGARRLPLSDHLALFVDLD